jgi:sugar diacid utilization regulator
MKISLDLIMEELKFDLETPRHENPSFSGAELYTLGISDASGKMLLVSKLSESLLVPKAQGMYFLCIRDRRQDDAETGESLQNIYIVNKNLNLNELFIAVQRVFIRIQNWIVQMQESVLNNLGLQALLNLCEPVIGNHITILDASFNLLAYTKNVYTDDAVQTMLVENGYHPEETLQKLQKYRRIEEYENADERNLIISQDRLMSPYDTVKKVYKYNNTFSAIVVMICCNRECSGAMLELFTLLVAHIKFYFDKEQPFYRKSRQIESFFMELIGRTVAGEQEAKKRAAALRIPFEGRFELNLIVYNDILNVPADRLVQDLSRRVNKAVVILYSRNILMLYQIEAQDDAEARRARLLSMLTGLNCNCGVSNPFESLWDMASAYEQAHSAVIMGERLRLNRQEANKFRFYLYEDYYLHHLVSNTIDSASGVFMNAFAFRSVKKLKRYEEKHSAKLLSTLSAYLQCGRSATAAGALLHMHRNTILYHIKKIEEILNVSLDDLEVRLKLQIGLKALEIDRI